MPQEPYPGVPVTPTLSLCRTEEVPTRWVSLRTNHDDRRRVLVVYVQSVERSLRAMIWIVWVSGHLNLTIRVHVTGVVSVTVSGGADTNSFVYFVIITELRSKYSECCFG